MTTVKVKNQNGVDNMYIQVRRDTFETNSSSTHTVQMSESSNKIFVLTQEQVEKTPYLKAFYGKDTKTYTQEEYDVLVNEIFNVYKRSHGSFSDEDLIQQAKFDMKMSRGIYHFSDIMNGNLCNDQYETLLLSKCEVVEIEGSKIFIVSCSCVDGYAEEDYY